MTYANINTNQTRDNLPSVLEQNGTTITNATIEHWKQLGWRIVRNTASPGVGYRVTAYAAVDVDGLYCDLTIAAQVLLADEVAAAKAAEISASKNILALTSTSDIGRLVRALAEVTLDEINALRANAGLAQRTQTQLLNAILAKLDAQ